MKLYDPLRDDDIVFVVGLTRLEIIDTTSNLPLSAWEMIGVFQHEQDAIAACTSSNHFYGPIVINQALPDTTMVWPSCKYPMQ